MVDSLKHKERYHVDKYFAAPFGIARVHLGIFNPEPQPTFRKDRFIVFDGKIYGYDSDKEKLKRKGYEFVYGNDSEFCLNSYAEYGAEFVEGLNGDFVFVICDLKENKMLIANDRYGLRPLYYALNNEQLLLASEVKAIIAGGGFGEVDECAVAEFFAFRWILGDKTFLKGVKMLPPASIAIYDGHTIRLRQYWDFMYRPNYTKSEDQFVDDLVEVWRKAVEMRTQTNLRYGVCLSGGLDSRLIVAAVPQQRREDLVALSIGDRYCDEVRIAKRVAKKARVKFGYMPITPEMVVDTSEEWTFHTEGLASIWSSLTVHFAQAFNNEAVSVVFDGLALDLTLGGSYLGKEILTSQTKEECCDAILKELRFFSEEELSRLFVKDFYDKVKDYPARSIKEQFDRINEDTMGDYSDHFWLRNYIRMLACEWYVVFRTSMETSFPTFDNILIDLILRIPIDFRRLSRIRRKFIKKLCPELARIPYSRTWVSPAKPLAFWKLGKKILFAEDSLRQAFTLVSKGRIQLADTQKYLHFDKWFLTSTYWKKYVAKVLLSKDALYKKYINQDYVKELVHATESQTHRRRMNYSLKVIYLMSFELFLRFLKREKQE